MSMILLTEGIALLENIMKKRAMNSTERVEELSYWCRDPGRACKSELIQAFDQHAAEAVSEIINEASVYLAMTHKIRQEDSALIDHLLTFARRE